MQRTRPPRINYAKRSESIIFSSLFIAQLLKTDADALMDFWHPKPVLTAEGRGAYFPRAKHSSLTVEPLAT